MKCFNCWRAIKNPYYFDGQTYGIECWKVIALPEIERRRQVKFEALKAEQWLMDNIHIQVLQLKDWSRITSDFKQNFASSVEEQFNSKGFLSRKQRDAISSYLFNGKDWKNYWRLAVEAGIDNKEDLIFSGLMTEKDF